MLTAVHRRPGLTRAEASQLLGIGSGAATTVVGRLVAARLLAEGPTAPVAGPGRPTRQLIAHPEGPLMLAAVIAHEVWGVAAVELGGVPIATLSGRHVDASEQTVMAAISEAVAQLRDRFADRVRGLGIGGPGIVAGQRYLDATLLGWAGADLWSPWPDAPVVIADNDATLAALAEARRGAAAGTGLALYLRVDAGLGGALVEAGRPVRGARGAAGEFGHLPLGDPTVTCACGAHGCWGTAVDGGALARLLSEPEPADPVTYAQQVLTRTDAAARAAVSVTATALGRGTAGLINAVDPDMVVLGAFAADLLAAAPEELHEACQAGLMRSRRATAVPLVPARLGERGPLIGAAERAWEQWLQGLHR
jgi:predicted NBD/HSP70 family sugar kinase